MRCIWLIGLLSLAVGAFAQGSAQNPPETVGGWGAGSRLNKLWNPSSEITFSGKVTGVQRSTPFRGMDPGVALLVRNSKGGTAMVEMGPSWFVDNQRVKLGIGDRVTVTGSKVILGGKSSILARKIVKNNRVMYLRGTDGFPMWIAARGHVTVGVPRPGTGAGAGTATTVVPLNNVEVVEVGNVALLDNPWTSSFVVVRGPNAELITVELGPTWFVSRQDLAFRVGDVLVIDAIRNPAGFNQGPLYIANSVRRGGDVMVLRYQNGRPVWEAWGGG